MDWHLRYSKRSLQTNDVKLVEYNPYLPNKGLCQGGSGVKILVGGQWWVGGGGVGRLIANYLPHQLLSLLL